MKKLTPEEMIKNVDAWAKNIAEAKRLIVAVGLPKEKVGGKIYRNSEMSIIRLGAIHEFGCTFSSRGRVIRIPRRSFLRTPFATKRKEFEKLAAAQFTSVAEKGVKARTAVGRMGAIATNISKGAFVTTGYGQWPKSKKSTGRTLIDTGTLKNSITWAVRNAGH